MEGTQVLLFNCQDPLLLLYAASHTHRHTQANKHTGTRTQTGKHTRTSYKTQALLPTAMARAMSVTT